MTRQKRKDQNAKAANHSKTAINNQKISIEVLSLRYDLHPGTREIWVEGTDDRRLLSWFLNAVGDNHTVVREIDQVHVDDDDVSQRGLRTGCNRDRVIALAAMLADTCNPSGLSSILCIADQDRYDLPRHAVPDVLKYTDYRDMENYLLTNRILGKFFQTACKFEEDCVQVFSWMLPLLRDLCAIHDANDALGWGMTVVSISNYVKYDRTARQLRMDLDGYIRAYLLRNSRMGNYDEFIAEVSQRRAQGGNDRLYIRGHTFIDVCTLYVAGRMPCSGSVAQVLCEALFSVVEVAWWLEEPLFGLLGARAKSYTKVA